MVGAILDLQKYPNCLSDTTLAIFHLWFERYYSQYFVNGSSDSDGHIIMDSLDSYIIILLLLKKVGSARLRDSDIHPIGPKTLAEQYQPIDRKKRKGKRVEDYSRDRAA